MKTVLTLILILAAVGEAQSLVPQALKETLNLAPRMQRGDVQKYKLLVDVVFLTEDGIPHADKQNALSYTQLCIANGADSGVIYDVTIDSFTWEKATNHSGKRRKYKPAT